MFSLFLRFLKIWHSVSKGEVFLLSPICTLSILSIWDYLFSNSGKYICIIHQIYSSSYIFLSSSGIPIIWILAFLLPSFVFLNFSCLYKIVVRILEIYLLNKILSIHYSIVTISTTLCRRALELSHLE